MKSKIIINEMSEEEVYTYFENLTLMGSKIECKEIAEDTDLEEFASDFLSGELESVHLTDVESGKSVALNGIGALCSALSAVFTKNNEFAVLLGDNVDLDAFEEVINIIWVEVFKHLSQN
jgi:hypothetical protein